MEQNRQVTLSPQVLMPHVLAAIEDGGTFVLTVTGNSMQPTLKPHRDAVELRKCGKLSEGQILLFRRQTGEYILHRLVKILPDGCLRMNGDGQNWTEAIFPDQVVAAAVRLRRKGKWYQCGTAADKCYIALWSLTRPLRGLLFKSYTAVRRLLKKK